MIKTIRWEATKRKPMTQGEMNEARKAGQVPAIVTHRGEDSIPIMMNVMDLEKRPFGNFRVELKIKGIKEPVDCFLKTLQYNHTADKIIHADFQSLTVGQEVDIDVSFEIVGEPEGLKHGGILNTSITSVKIRTLPKNIPEKITVDISHLKIGEAFNITEVEFSEEHTLLEPTEGAIAYVSEPRLEEVEPADGPEEMPEPEIISERSED
ncbi:MAG: 50S ribosomal protein L25 [Denitrovibrio sp.]|nr:MAG: 50S ribosomal protein L25 [Denitrovibrio sp.]